MKTDARQTALRILDQQQQSGQVLDRIIDREWRRAGMLPARDRAFTSALVFGVMRWRERLDWIIAHFSKTPIQKIDPTVLNILRLALFQIVFMDRVPESAAVNTAVELAKQHTKPFVVKYVNAILRQALRNKKQIERPTVANRPLDTLALQKSFPVWLISRWVDRYGWDETNRLCDAVNAIPPVTIRTNTLQTTREHLERRLQGAVNQLEPTRLSPEGIRLYGLSVAVQDLPGFAAGMFQVQDEAAQLISHLVAPAPGHAVLDACAGMGGKTAHLAQLMKNQGRITALDASRPKLERLTAEMARLGITIVSAHEHDLNTRLPDLCTGPYDRILLDAPCSGLGVLRRNPDAKWTKSPETVRQCSRRQQKFLSRIAAALKPGGVLVYAVCTNEPEETRAVTDAFLRSCPAFSVLEPPAPLFCQNPDLTDYGRHFNILPHQHDTDGFFAVRFTKK